MNELFVVITGFILGALSWAVCPIVSDSYEPFDTGIGLAIGQVLASVFIIYIGYRTTVLKVITGIFGLYLGQNLYTYVLGSSEARAWVLLGLVSTIFLCIIPLILGLLARLVNIILERRNAIS